ncbi:protein vein isoform X3 [Drosophila kikkawai]|uniref:Protein vein isoform X3 n=1 Tax=Drosophila kikkawai TaxID=30033 RepID=A0ABM3C5H2_DROKI
MIVRSVLLISSVVLLKWNESVAKLFDYLKCKEVNMFLNCKKTHIYLEAKIAKSICRINENTTRHNDVAATTIFVTIKPIKDNPAAAIRSSNTQQQQQQRQPLLVEPRDFVNKVGAIAATTLEDAMYAQHLRKWSLKTKKQRMPLILLIISYMLLLITGVSAAATAVQQQRQLPAARLLWEGSAEESSYYIPLSSDNDGGSISGSSSSSSSESGSNIDSNSNNILSRLLSRTSNSLSSRSNLKLEPATVFDAGSSAANQQQQQQQEPLQQHVAAVPQKKVPNTLIISQIYNNLLYNGLPSEAAPATSSKMRRHIQPAQLPAPVSSFSHPASNYSRRALQRYYIESFEIPEEQQEQIERNPEQAARSRRDGQNQRRPNGHRKELQAEKRENRRLRQQQRKEQRPNRHQEPQRRKHQRKHRGRQRSDRYCSARDPAQLAYAAPTVFKGVFKSMSADRRLNFSASMKVVEVYKQQRGLQLPTLVRLQFTVRNNSGECDIYREKLRPRGVLRSGNDLQQATSIEYVVFAQQTNPGNFTILGQPMRASHSVMEAVKTAVSDNYAQNASIISITAVPSNTTIEHGRELKIVCRVSGQPPPKVTWFKDDKSINRKRNVYQFKHHKRRSELIVRSFNSSSDAGKYECRAKNKASKAIIRRRIMINSSPVPFRPDQDTDVPCPFTDFCFHGGTCRMIKDMNLFYCRCQGGYVGERCENIGPDSGGRYDT